MTLMQLMYFREVAKTRHFTAAANNLYVAQSSLSYAIHELEKELGVPLFIRYNNKTITLSDYGQAFLPFVENALLSLDEGKNEIESLKSPLYGKVKIAFFFSVALTTVPYLIHQFKTDNPDNHIKLNFEVYHNWTDLRDFLLRGRCDLVISCNELSSNIESRQFATQKIILIVPRWHPLAKKDFVTIEDIRNETIIAIDPTSNLDTAVKNMFTSANISPKLTYVTNWTSAQLHISSGDGISFSTDIPVDDNYLVKLPIDHPEAFMPLYL
ncbi:MAG: LysR family transcriptional regulator, partial [Lachnospiraceae bacterium]|nr:LysR family transcriptional regulator [Lachnospiraceae bacterium]